MNAKQVFAVSAITLILILIGCKPTVTEPYRVVAKKSANNTYAIEDVAHMGTDPYRQLSSDALNAQIRGNWKKVKKLGQQMIALDPNRYTGYLDLGIAQVQLDEYAESVPTLEKATMLHPGATRGWEALAIAYYNLGNTAKYEQARKQFELLNSKKQQ